MEPTAPPEIPEQLVLEQSRTHTCDAGRLPTDRVDERRSLGTPLPAGTPVRPSDRGRDGICGVATARLSGNLTREVELRKLPSGESRSPTRRYEHSLASGRGVD